MHARFCLCPPRLKYLFPLVLWKSCNQIPLAFKVRFPGDSQSFCQIPRLGSLTWGWEPSQQWENFFGIIVLQFVGHPPGGYGIWFYCDCAPPTILLQFLLCLWTWGILFWWVPVLMVVQQLVVILVLLQEEMSTHPSTLPSWTSKIFLKKFKKCKIKVWWWGGKLMKMCFPATKSD